MIQENSDAERDLLAMTMTLALVTGQLRATTHKTPPADVGSGRIAWFDITTTSLPRSKEFYGRLFDWQFTPVQGTDQAAEIVSGGTAIGTLRVAEGNISPFNGVVYVQVTDIRASCRKVTQLGEPLWPGFPSIYRTGPEPSPCSQIRLATRSACTRGPRSLPRRPRPGEDTGSSPETLIEER